MSSIRYPIRAVSNLTGLSIDTLRAWERRYGAVEPSRNDRGRLYSDRDVARLKQLASLVSGGHAISSVAGLSDAHLRRLADDGTSVAPPSASADLEPLFAAAGRFELDSIDAYLSRLALTVPPRDFILGVAMPLLHEVGRRWEAGAVRASQEHLISAIIRSVLGGMLRAIARRVGAPRMVFATLSGERHELGLLAAAVLAASAGAEAIYIGPDLPTSEVVHAVVKSDAHALVLAATATGAIDRASLRALARLPLPVRIIAGGPNAGAVVDALKSRVRVVRSLPDLEDLVSTFA